MTYRLINDDGTLTPAGRAKYNEMAAKSEKSAETDRAAIDADKPTVKPKEQPKDKAAPGFSNATQSDWALLMNYDRKTGNLLKYDPETGQLDENSRNILQDPATVQRLIDNRMILPGGWLTPAAKQQCARMGEGLEKKQPADSVSSETVAKNDKSPEALSQTDMEILLQHDPSNKKLDLKHPAIIKDPAVVKRLLDHNMIEANGKLTTQALAWCRDLRSLNHAVEQKAQEKKVPKKSIAQKLQTVTAKSKSLNDSKQPNEQKVKIIRLKEDEIGAKPKEEKARKITHDVKAVSKPRSVPEKPVKAPLESKFALGKTSPKYDGREIEKELITLRNPHSFEAEQFKILRTNLLFAKSGKIPRSVMVTSAMPGEGKTFVAANLAISIAQHVNWNVLLIDCDLRRPNVHRQFGFLNATGLSEYLANGTDLEPLLLKTGIENLTILPAGTLPDNPSELLSSERMASLLHEVSTRYNDRLIILDSPPPKMTAEAGALARYVDGILLVVKYGGTPKDSVTELISKLGKDKILGAVINNFDAGFSRYQKKYYGGHYYSS
jgi:exopolysaccharide/PEP-CTERM locus tyrosine autokinase